MLVFYVRSSGTVTSSLQLHPSVPVSPCFSYCSVSTSVCVESVRSAAGRLKRNAYFAPLKAMMMMMMIMILIMTAMMTMMMTMMMMMTMTTTTMMMMTVMIYHCC